MITSTPSNFLIINPIFGFSHVKFLSKLADIMADRGHQVVSCAFDYNHLVIQTILQPFHIPMNNIDGLIKNKHVDIINYYPDNFDQIQPNESNTFAQFWDSKLVSNPVLGAFLSKMVSNQFKSAVTKMLRDTKLHTELISKQFDAVLVETFELSGFYLADIINVPAIACLSAVRYPIFEQLFGQPSTLGYIPQKGSRLPPSAGFFDRLNDIYQTFFLSIGQKGLNDAQYNMISEAIGRKVERWEDIIARSPIYITNSNPYLDFAVPNTSNIIQIGGITIPKEKKVEALPEEYEKILKERESTVLISFGSVVRSYEMPDNFKNGVIEMFHNLPDVTFIWKYEKDDDELEKRLPNNVHLKKWVPQPALLADDRLKVFLTHGGLGSTMEVAYAGKPALMVPLFADQFQNAQMLSRLGTAVDYDKFDLKNGKKLTRVMKEMIGNLEYKKNADHLMDILINQPIDPRDNFLKHLEFAVKFPNLKSQRPDIVKSGLIGYHYLDVKLFLFVLTGLFIGLIIALVALLVI